MSHRRRNSYGLPAWFWLLMILLAGVIVMVMLAGTTGWDPLQLLER